MDKWSPGLEGEVEAAKYLENNGYKILKKNYRVSGSEVDLIVEKDETLCFVEVKTRGTDDFGLPEEFVDERKRRRIIRAAKIFSSQKCYQNYYVRFDIIAVRYIGTVEGKGSIIPIEKINHIEHAFTG